MRRNIANVLGIMGCLAVVVTGRPGRVVAAEPTIDLEGAVHVITFTSPPVYDLSINDSSAEGGVANATLIAQDQKGNLDGVIIDKSDDIELTTNVTGNIRRSGDVTIIKEKLVGEGSLGNGDTMSSRGSKRSEIRQGLFGAATIHSVLKIKTCARFKQPFSEKYNTTCSSGGGSHDAAYTRSGDWTVRLELVQSAGGALSGTGTIVTNPNSTEFRRETAVFVQGKSKDEGLAKVKLTSLFKGGDGPVTMLLQLNGVQYPAVLQVLAVKGKLLGQTFSQDAF